jgi:hypothetical protein
MSVQSKSIKSESSKKRKYPFFDREEAEAIIIEQGLKKMKLQTDLTQIISRIA